MDRRFYSMFPFTRASRFGVLIFDPQPNNAEPSKRKCTSQRGHPPKKADRSQNQRGPLYFPRISSPFSFFCFCLGGSLFCFPLTRQKKIDLFFFFPAGVRFFRSSSKGRSVAFFDPLGRARGAGAAEQLGGAGGKPPAIEQGNTAVR